MKINILNLYNDILNLYGDNGNLKIIKYHLDDLKIDYNIDYLSIDDEIEFNKYDLIVIGSGTEENRNLALKHLIKYKKDVLDAIDKGIFFLVTGNAVALFGRDIYKEKALMALDLYVDKANERIVKEVSNPCIDICLTYGIINTSDIVHNRETTLYEGEGIQKNHFFGTYQIGPILARDPIFTKYFIEELLFYKDPKYKIKDLNLDLDIKAAKQFVEFKKTKVFNSKHS